MTIQFDENGYALTSGFTTVYNISYETREFMGAHETFISATTGVPAQAYLDIPPKPKNGFAICRTIDDLGWEYVEDHRGEIRYSTITKQTISINELGEYPKDSTDMEPSLFDVWDGNKWVVDEKAKADAMIKSATLKKSELKSIADSEIAWRQDAVDIGIATEKEKKSLDEWKRYRVELSRIDISKPIDIKFPTQPKG
jgi:hypothetical protein